MANRVARQLLRPLPRRSADREPHALQRISPNRWEGQCGCAVGPFSSQGVAETFAALAAARGRCTRGRMQVFVCRDAWYVEVGPPG